MRVFVLLIMVFAFSGVNAALPLHQKQTLPRLRARATKQYLEQKKIAFSQEESMQTRWRAILALATLSHPQQKKDLIQLSKNKEWFVRNASLMALDKVDSSLALKLAKRLIGDKALVVRSLAADILKNYQNEPTVRQLLWSELERPYNFRGAQSLWIRKQILSILASQAQEKESEIFLRYSKDQDVEINRIATAVLAGALRKE